MEYYGPYNPHDTKLFICDKCQTGRYVTESMTVCYCNNLSCGSRMRKATAKEKEDDIPRVTDIKEKYRGLFRSEFFVPFRYAYKKLRQD